MAQVLLQVISIFVATLESGVRCPTPKSWEFLHFTAPCNAETRHNRFAGNSIGTVRMMHTMGRISDVKGGKVSTHLAP